MEKYVKIACSPASFLGLFDGLEKIAERADIEAMKSTVMFADNLYLKIPSKVGGERGMKL